MIKILKTNETPVEELFSRTTQTADVSGVVSEIIETVKTRGDSALLEYTEKFDHVALKSLEVSADEINDALIEIDPEFLSILYEAADNIRAFHKNQLRSGFVITNKPGVVMGQKVLPLEKVGIYVPGGTAPLPSTVLMNAIPATLAGCRDIIMTTPCRRDGSVTPEILAAAKIAGVSRIFKVGGAQAVAALAYGTESVPKVDKIVGPGNQYVAEAKRRVYGEVDIDMIAGPSEILVIADKTASPKRLAADLLSQAEHDKLATAVLITDCAELAEKTAIELEEQLKVLPREEIARTSIERNGKIIIAESIEEALALSNDIAPEHLELCVENPFDLLSEVKNAGSIFMGHSCPESLGDYFAGPNHTLPTSGTARFSSPLSVDDFVKKSQFTYFTAEAFGTVAEKVAAFAEKEGLSAHARSALARLDK